jgi:hypothetical protein
MVCKTGLAGSNPTATSIFLSPVLETDQESLSPGPDYRAATGFLIGKFSPPAFPCPIVVVPSHPFVDFIFAVIEFYHFVSRIMH